MLLRVGCVKAKIPFLFWEAERFAIVMLRFDFYLFALNTKEAISLLNFFPFNTEVKLL
jgi:hypothetical protein